jgi:hypothetical protein
VQVNGKIENKTFTIVNLPSTFNQELSTGVAIINLHQAGEETLVSLIMSRRYTWQGEGENTMKSKRASSEFQAGTSAMWNDFLSKLKSLSESS